MRISGFMDYMVLGRPFLILGSDYDSHVDQGSGELNVQSSDTSPLKPTRGKNVFLSKWKSCNVGMGQNESPPGYGLQV